MHLRAVWIGLALLAAFAASGAVIYKWTDADGVVHFSDQAVPGAERIVTAAPAGASSPRITQQGAQASSQAPAAAPPGSLAIISPSNGQTFFNDDVVTVSLSISPPLTPTQSLSWHLNGQQLQDLNSNATAFALPKLPRGTYAIAATVTDQQTGESQSSPSVTFYVRQPSELSPQHK